MSGQEKEPVKRVPIRRANDSGLSELSDSEFVEKLRESLEGRSWSMRQIAELQRRGLGIIEDDPPLREAINESGLAFLSMVREMSTAGLQEFHRTTSQALDPLRERIAEVSLLFPKTEFPRLDSPMVPAWSESLAEIEPLNLSELPVSPTLEMQVAQLEALSEIQEEIRESRRRGWSYWLLVTLTAIAALAAVTSVVLALI